MRAAHKSVSTKTAGTRPCSGSGFSWRAPSSVVIARRSNSQSCKQLTSSSATVQRRPVPSHGEHVTRDERQRSLEDIRLIRRAALMLVDDRKRLAFWSAAAVGTATVLGWQSSDLRQRSATNVAKAQGLCEATRRLRHESAIQREMRQGSERTDRHRSPPTGTVDANATSSVTHRQSVEQRADNNSSPPSTNRPTSCPQVVATR